MTKLADTPLSVLDLAPVAVGKTPADAFRNTLALAQHVERLNYKRFWVAEHHNLSGVASSATSVLIGYVAAGTSQIRVGSGGVMLPNHAPLLIAEQFGTLESIYPGRIDLGLGRAPGTDSVTSQALRRGLISDGHDFPELLAELMRYFEPPSPGQRVHANPGAGMDIPIWLLGSSTFSAQLAAYLGLPFSFASHFAPEELHAAIKVYRNKFTPSASLKEPYVMIGVPVIAADSDKEAERLATSTMQKFLGLVRGQRTNTLPPVDTMDGVWTESERMAVMSRLSYAAIGGPEKVKRRLEDLLAATGANEVMIVSDFYDFEDRLRSYQIVADAKQAARDEDRVADGEAGGQLASPTRATCDSSSKKNA
jgi:luciferase family oxidoreductase group 1